MKRKKNKKISGKLIPTFRLERLFRSLTFSRAYQIHDSNPKDLVILKKGISIPFEWIFAMILGGIILFVAIYAASQFAETGSRTSNTEAAARLESLLSPFETGLASGKSSKIHFASESRIYFQECDENENHPFGTQSIAFTQKFFNKFSPAGENISIKNKYVFAEEVVQGKDFYVFSKPFFMGYKVADIIIIDSKKYCFYQTPEEIKEGIENLNLENINFSEDFECKGITVCFDEDNSKCDIEVYPLCEDECESSYDYGKISKYDENGKKISEIYFIGNLVYGGIFSSEKIYECNVKRLMNKFSELGKIYNDKIKLIEIRDCSSNIAGRLNVAISGAKSLRESQGLIILDSNIKEIIKINNAAKEGCQLFSGE